jgi:hypothetical protein
LLLIMNREVPDGRQEIDKIGIFDTIGWLLYENADQLAGLILTANDASPLQTSDAQVDRKAPVYILEGMVKSEAATRTTSRAKKRGLKCRTFDPNETPRLAAHDVITQVSRSFGVILSRLSSSATDARFHNLRASFIAGLAVGMGKELGDYPLDARTRLS